MLDKNYAWKFEPRRWYFDPEPGVIDQHVDGTTSELLNLYLIMAQVQDEALSLSKSILLTESRSAQHPFRNSVEFLLTKMENVRQRIEQVRYHICPYPPQPHARFRKRKLKTHRVNIDSISICGLLEGA